MSITNLTSSTLSNTTNVIRFPEGAEGFPNMILYESKVFGSFRVLMREDGEPWFVAKDISEALDLGPGSQAVRYLDDDEYAVLTKHSLTANPNGKLTIINEPGLYSLILRSRKPEAKAFKRWVTHDVLPSIRKTGGYIVDRPDDTPPSRLSLKVHLLLRATACHYN